MKRLIYLLNGNRKQAIAVSLKKGELAIVSAGKTLRMKIGNEEWIKLNVEGDFTPKWFNMLTGNNYSIISRWQTQKLLVVTQN